MTLQESALSILSKHLSRAYIALFYNREILVSIYDLQVVCVVFVSSPRGTSQIRPRLLWRSFQYIIHQSR